MFCGRFQDGRKNYLQIGLLINCVKRILVAFATKPTSFPFTYTTVYNVGGTFYSVQALTPPTHPLSLVSLSTLSKRAFSFGSYVLEIRTHQGGQTLTFETEKSVLSILETQDRG